MAIFDTWAKYIIKVANAESEYAENLVDHPTLIGDAREFIVESVLKRILPPGYEVGRGQVIDSNGKTSNQIDIVIARMDSPALALPGGDKLYLIESVLGTIEVKSHLDAGTLREALDNCASVGDLSPAVHAPYVKRVLRKRGIRLKPDGTRYHKEHLEVLRSSTLGYPATYIFGFTGYTNRYAALRDSIGTWMDGRWANNKEVLPRHLPSVIAAEGCFGCMNAPPFEATPADQNVRPAHYVVGTEETPLRMLIFHLLNIIFAKTPWPPDIEGLRMEPRRYLAQMKNFRYEGGITFEEPPGYHEGIEGALT